MHLVARLVTVVVRVVLIADGVIVLVRVVVVMPVIVAGRVVVAGAVRHKLVNGLTAVTSRIGFTPQRYISCGLCARRTPPPGSAPRDCLPFQSWCSAGRGRCANWLKLNK